ncbi:MULTISPECIES: hypothetical protein [Pseudomonas syringae group]|uniref:hypothetical protein n=1 Tax=Pseudomonas syringae group TaxID=136849 RepID=UPI0018AD0C2E|nr:MULTISPECIES: hypothetical protein [Pseudomonas syringae group]
MNPFKIDILRRHYDAMKTKWALNHSDLFTPEGLPHMGSGGAQAFWLGFQGKTFGAGFKTRAEKQSPNYASWRAGRACALVAAIKPGQVWSEVTPGYTRHVKVIGFCSQSGKVEIESAGKTTLARPERFNGKSGGYALVSE